MPAPPPRLPQRTELPAVVFVAGVAMLGIEMLMPRLLAPYFGTAQPIWAIIISSTLLFLAAGYWLGGRLADHDPRLVWLYRLLAWAGLACALIPLVARPILRTARLALLDVAAGTFLAALGGAVLLFAVPVTLLAAVSHWRCACTCTTARRACRRRGGRLACSRPYLPLVHCWGPY